jgi:excinuclease UvrABC ATPase subunit
VDFERIIDKTQPIKNAILPWRDSSIGQKILTKLSMEYDFNLDVKWENLDEELKNIILYGD